MAVSFLTFENNEKAFQFCQTRNLIPSNDSGAEGKVSVCKYSRNENFPYELRCTQKEIKCTYFNLSTLTNRRLRV